jgi:hypothetical protein
MTDFSELNILIGMIAFGEDLVTSCTLGGRERFVKLTMTERGC